MNTHDNPETSTDQSFANLAGIMCSCLTNEDIKNIQENQNRIQKKCENILQELEEQEKENSNLKYRFHKLPEENQASK